MWDSIIEALTAVPFWELALILIAKIIEVTLGTLRVILINKGYRKQGTLLAFIEIILWVFIASTVITGMSEAPIKGIMYSFGFAGGVYLGSYVESKIAMGKILVQVICDIQTSAILSETIRNSGMGLTSWNAEGKESEKKVLLLIGTRKSTKKILKLISETDQKAVVAIHDASVLKGGFYPQVKKILK